MLRGIGATLSIYLQKMYNLMTQSDSPRTFPHPQPLQQAPPQLTMPELQRRIPRIPRIVAVNIPVLPTIGVCSDHAGYECKEYILDWLHENGYKYTDYGTHNMSSCDYPDYIHPMAHDVGSEKIAYGIAICGTGQGMAMTANKYTGVRAAVCWNADIAELARQHNDANILCIPARYITDKIEVCNIIYTFLGTVFEGGRHCARVDKIDNVLA